MFLPFIPKGRRRRPQLFPMLSPDRLAATARPRAIATGIAGGTVLAVAVAAHFAPGAPNAGARTDTETRVGAAAHVGKAAASALATAVGQSTSGPYASEYQPPGAGGPEPAGDHRPH